MDHYEEQTETITRRVKTYTTCDGCGATTRKEHWSYDGSETDWTETTISLRSREVYSCDESFPGEVIEADLCPKCFKEKLVPALEALGVVFRREE